MAAREARRRVSNTPGVTHAFIRMRPWGIMAPWTHLFHSFKRRGQSSSAWCSPCWSAWSSAWSSARVSARPRTFRSRPSPRCPPPERVQRRRKPMGKAQSGLAPVPRHRKSPPPRLKRRSPPSRPSNGPNPCAGAWSACANVSLPPAHLAARFSEFSAEASSVPQTGKKSRSPCSSRTSAWRRPIPSWRRSSAASPSSPRLTRLASVRSCARNSWPSSAPTWTALLI